ncbi:MAG TPA: metalloregulator ArsR/SmtB family transcription factor [Chloroflexota bacterium]|nr:metalloregulator ArsR/SmtB family transcription factor [Chloroflexota bacterium]
MASTETRRAVRQGAAVATEAVQDADCVTCPPLIQSPLSPEAAAQHVAVLKALADPQRLRIMALIAAQPRHQPLCVCDVEAAFELSQPTISHHLRVLRQAGLVTMTKRGLWHYYAPAPGALAPVRHLLATLDRAPRPASPVSG